jgi:opacity protein-like surface antigen
MKKIIAIAAIAATLATSHALAKTEGNYVGVDILRTTAENQYKPDGGYGKFKDSSVGVGVNYKYAFNFNQVFLAPGVFFDQLGTKAKDLDGDNVSANYRYGAKLDLGYDITDEFAVYFTNGLSALNYEVNWKSVDEKKSATQLGYFYGAGLSYKVIKDVVLSFEYNNQSLNNLKTPDASTKVKADIRVAKIGISYNF